MDNPQPANTPLENLQNHFAIIDLSGETRVVNRLQVADFLSGKSTNEPAFYKKVDSSIWMKRVLEKLPYPCDPATVIKNFWVDPGTTVYQGTAFTPPPSPLHALNFWVGPCEPNNEGSATLILKYLLDVICSGDANTFAYLICYLAHMVQRPHEKPGVMLVLLGRQGTGKGMFFKLLRALWARTTLLVTDVDQVIGRFNACLERNYAICMDEALFAGDRKALDHLKSMITESHINIEQKYQPARSIESVHRFFAASNHDHFAHVEMDDRRFVFLSVSDIHQQDATYFAQLATTLQDPSAVGAFLHHLQGLELRSFNVRQKPNTNQHLLQKIKSLQGVARYWYEVLLAGDLDAGTNQFSAGSTWTEQMFTPTSDLVRHYTTFNKNAQRHQTVQSGDVLSTVQKLCPSAVTARQLCYQYGQSKKVQKRGLQLPDLKTARLEFEQAIGGAIRWI
jgi:hypothetical protein